VGGVPLVPPLLACDAAAAAASSVLTLQQQRVWDKATQPSGEAGLAKWRSGEVARKRRRSGGNSALRVYHFSTQFRQSQNFDKFLPPRPLRPRAADATERTAMGWRVDGPLPAHIRRSDKRGWHR
jgi:hypothetical protein